MLTPPPVMPPAQAAMPRRRWSIPLVVVAALISIGVIGASFIPVPFVAYAPGDARPTSPRISVDGVKTYPVNGQVLFVTVGLPRLTALGWLVGKLNPSKVDVFTEQQVFGSQTPSENRQENLKLMSYSKDFAAYVALKHLGYPVTVDHGGVVVQSLCLQTDANGTCTMQSPVSDKLKVNDVITAVNGTPVNVIPDLSAILTGKQVGDPITLSITRDGQPITVQSQLVQSSDGRAIVGFYPNPSPPDSITFSFPFKVDIDSGQIGGPSAGLAFTLGLLDALTPGSLTGGVKVAATGTISPTGDVGEIGGVKQKTIAVMRTGAKVFLVPASEQAEAEASARGSNLKVVGVNTLDDALKELASLGGNALNLGQPGAEFKPAP